MSREVMKLALEALAVRFSEGWHEGIKIDASDIMLLNDAAQALAEQQAQQEPVNKYCCHLCFNNSGQVFLDRMILCPECGNKRCPKATHHGLPCTKSNDVGQKGSIYDQPAQRTWVGLTHDEIKAAYLAVSEIEWAICGMDDAVPFTRIIEAKLREKNNG